MMIEVIVVDDHPTTRMGLHILLEITPGIYLVGEADCGIKALELLSKLKPDILLLDYRLPDMSGPQVSSEVQKLNLRTRVLGFSAYSDEEYIIKMLDAGAQGYVLKNEDPNMVLDAIRTVARGETWISPSISSKLLNRTRRELANHSLLSHRELEVLQLLAKGYSNLQIAESLFISKATVKNHLTNIYNSLSVGSRAEAITWAWSNALIEGEHSQGIKKER
jgi:two-component system, NarL family, response regulator DegU